MKRLVLMVYTFCTISTLSLTAQDSSVLLKIDLLKNRIVLGEPLIVEVSLQNPGTTTVWVVQDLDIIRGACQYLIADTNGVYRAIHQSVYLDWDAKEKPLSAGTQVRHEQVLLYDPERADIIFDRPGVYSLQVQLGARKSNAIQFTVEAPHLELKESTTYRLFQEKNVLRHLQWPLPKVLSNPLEDKLILTCLNERTELTETLACLVAERAIDRDMTRDKAERVLKMLDIPDVAQNPWRSKVVFLKARVCQQLGDNAQSTNLLYRLHKDYPESFDAWSEKRSQGKR